MYKFFLLILLGIAVIGTSCGRNITANKDKFVSMLCQEWLIPNDFDLNNDSLNRAEVIPPAEGQGTVLFRMDGTFKVNFSSGLWSYNERSQQLTLTRKTVKQQYKVVKIEESELIIQNLNGNSNKVITLYRS